MANTANKTGIACAIVTGATSGIGEAIATALANDGYALFLVGRRAEEGETIAAALRAKGAKAVFHTADMAERSSPEAIVEAALAAFGRLDVLINNAGILIHGTVEDTTDADWDKVLDINLSSVFRLSRAAVPALRAQGGAIVNIASDWALVGAKGAVAYAVSKAAVAQLTRCMALDHAAEGIRVNAVCPGDTDTPMLAAGLTGAARADRIAKLGAEIPIGRVGTPQDIASVVAFLASDAARYITGALLPVDGGASAD